MSIGCGNGCVRTKAIRSIQYQTDSPVISVDGPGSHWAKTEDIETGTRAPGVSVFAEKLIDNTQQSCLDNRFDLYTDKTRLFILEGYY